MSDKVRVLVVGCGLMGSSHARAYHKQDGFEIVGLVSPRDDARKLSEELGGYPVYDDFDAALAETKPDAVSVNTYPDTHARFATAAMESGAHVFVEKPLAQTVADARALADAARSTGRKVVVGYILRHHPSWVKFIELARGLGKPLVMRMNLNQQRDGADWEYSRHLLESCSPIVDCGVHYVDVMCQMTRAKPVRVHAVGARLSDDVPEGMYNYGQLQVEFDDKSIGWYEAGWGPMMSETAFFIKDVVGPKGAVSIASGEKKAKSSDTDSHTVTNALRVHHSEFGPDGKFAREDEIIDMSDEPDHQGLCDREQEFFLKAMREDIDLTEHLEDAVNSLRIVLAADESVRTGEVVGL